MARRGQFRAASLDSEWRGMELLARMCERAGLTNQEARSMLLYARGIGFAWQAAVMGLKSRQAAYDHWKRAVEKLSGAFDPLLRRHEIEQAERFDEDWASVLLTLHRNPRRRPDHGPQAVRDAFGRWWEGGRDPVVTAHDLGEETPEERFLGWLENWLQATEAQEKRVGTADRVRLDGEGRTAA